MSTPRASSAYPPSMLEALQRALDQGELFIPCPGKISPAALRLQFYGLISALRRESKPELCDSLGFYLETEPPGLWIKLKDLSGIGELIGAALGKPSGETPPDPFEEAFARITQGEKP